MFKIEMLQAGWGDSLWIEYGDSGNPFRILIDGGITSTYKSIEKRILALPEDRRRFELFVITHIDGDHIEGSIKLLGRLQKLNVSIGDVWFNGYEHLQGVDDDRLGGIYGEFLSALIKKQNLNWNKAFGGKAVVVPNEGELPVADLAGDLKITILSPHRKNLTNLIPDWNKEIAKYGLEENRSLEDVLEILEKRSALRPEDEFDDRLGKKPVIDIKSLAETYFEEDDAKANGSSIAILMQYKDPEDVAEKSCLLTGDAFPSVISASLKRLGFDAQSKIKLDLLKVSHHGSKNNTNKEMLKLINCDNYFFSSSGQKFSHPNKETVALVLVYGSEENAPRLFFNYKSKFNEIWDDSKLMKGDYPYKIEYVKDSMDGVSINL